jgi:hypothetical protein
MLHEIDDPDDAILVNICGEYTMMDLYSFDKIVGNMKWIIQPVAFGHWITINKSYTLFQ